MYILINIQQSYNLKVKVLIFKISGLTTALIWENNRKTLGKTGKGVAHLLPLVPWVYLRPEIICCSPVSYLVTYQSLLSIKRRASLRAPSGFAHGFNSSVSPFSMTDTLDWELPDILLLRDTLPPDFHSVGLKWNGRNTFEWLVSHQFCLFYCLG